MIDLLILLAFVVYAVSVGLASRRKASRGLEHYFLAGRTLKGWQAGTSMAATQFAADTPLLVVGLVATAGIFGVWRLLVYGIAFLLMGYLFSALWRRAGVLTDAELTEVRYSGRGVLALRVLKAIYYGTVINCVVLAMVLVAAVRIAEVFLPWHRWLPGALYDPVVSLVGRSGLTLSGAMPGLDPAVATANNLISVLAIVVFTALYSTTGGLRSVVRTDVVQFGLAMVGTLVYAWIVVAHVGGLSRLVPTVVEIYGPAQATTMLSFAPSLQNALVPFLVIVGLQWLFQMNSDGTGYLAQRCMACETDRDARSAAVLFAWMQIFARSLMWMVIAVGLLVIYPFSPDEVGGPAFVASREILFVTGIEDLLPVGVRGLMLTGLLAALASTIDTHLNWGASYWSNDIYKRLIATEFLKRTPSERELVLVARLSSGIIIGISFVIMVNLGSIQAAWFISLLFGAGMGSVLVLRWLWDRVNLYSEIAAIVVSLAIAPVLLLVTEQEWIRLGVMAIVSTTVVVLVTLLTPRTDAAVLEAFYSRVKPAGFWRHTALRAGTDADAPARRLRHGLAATALTGASLYLCLFGVATLLIRTPGLAPFWSWLALAAGVVLIPSWWRRMRWDSLPQSQ